MRHITHTIRFERRPHVDLSIVVRRKYVRAAGRDIHRGHTRRILRVQRAILGVGVFIQLAVRAHIKQSHRAIVRASHDALAVGEPFHSVDVGYMPREVRDAAVARAHVPHLASRVHRARHKQALVLLVEVDAHHIARMIHENVLRRARLHIPQNARAIATGRDDLAVVDETGTRQITVVLFQFAMNLFCTKSTTIGTLLRVWIGGLKNGDGIIQSTTGDKFIRRRESTRHHPCRVERNRQLFVAGMRRPNNEFTVLRCRHNRIRLWAPMQRVNLTKMTSAQVTLFRFVLGNLNVARQVRQHLLACLVANLRNLLSKLLAHLLTCLQIARC
mmetsp:Transcript_4181/g.7078  ORF Transcript_4181/g.7078 Transcript_4181/m.7078 type:complete len:330 (+) Transcript_4181:594-1583(+)